MKLYREVKTSDRLPKQEGWYLTLYGVVKLVDGQWRQYEDDSPYTFKVIDSIIWLELVDVKDEELDDIIYQAFKHGSGSYSENSINAAKAILSKLSGE